jgi:WD40 repeat protein
VRWFPPALPSLADVERAAVAGTLPTLVAELHGHSERHRWLARALRVDLATITAHPQLAFPCVWNRSLSFDRARLGFRLSPPPADVPSLHTLLERWRTEYGTRPWARSLRPPCFPLDGALREEYRGDYRDTLDVAIDDANIIVRGHTTVAWDRERGICVPCPEERPQIGKSWKVDLLPAGTHWGRYRIVDKTSETIVLDSRVNDDDSFQTFAVTPDGRWIVTGGWFDEYQGTVCLFERDRGTMRWRTELVEQVSAVTASADGAVVAAFSSGMVTFLDGSNGRTISSAFVGAGSGALDASGRYLVTHTSRALRVWEVAALCQNAEGLRGVEDGFVGATFSPDGRTLLTGAALCDALDGKLLAVLEVDGPGYLEGGPPEKGRALSNDRFVELAPFGLQVWETVAGRTVVDDPSRGATRRDEVRVGRDGRHYVRARAGQSRRELGMLAILAVDGGRISEIPPTDVRTFELDPDGMRLATGHADGTVRVWRVPDGALLSECRTDVSNGAPVHALAFSADGARIAAGTESGMLHQWEAATGAHVAARKVDERDGAFRIVSDGPRCWSGSEDAIMLLHGWQGFRSRLHPYRTQWVGGFLVVEHDGNAHAPIPIPIDCSLVFDDSGSRAAWRGVHMALEQV